MNSTMKMILQSTIVLNTQPTIYFCFLVRSDGVFVHVDLSVFSGNLIFLAPNKARVQKRSDTAVLPNSVSETTTLICAALRYHSVFEFAQTVYLILHQMHSFSQVNTIIFLSTFVLLSRTYQLDICGHGKRSPSFPRAARVPVWFRVSNTEKSDAKRHCLVYYLLAWVRYEEVLYRMRKDRCIMNIIKDEAFVSKVKHLVTS